MKNKEGKVKEILARKNSHTPKFPFLFFPENLRGKFLLQKPTNFSSFPFPFPFFFFFKKKEGNNRVSSGFGGRLCWLL